MCEHHKFQFDVDKAFAHQVLTRLLESPVHSLEMPEAPKSHGIYALFANDVNKPVYIGVTLSDEGLRKRLREHWQKVSGRKGLDAKKITCRYLEIDKNWEAVRAEDELIRHFNPEWNGIAGFSMHVPGSGRPGMPGYVNQWDRLFPPST